MEGAHRVGLRQQRAGCEEEGVKESLAKVGGSSGTMRNRGTEKEKGWAEEGKGSAGRVRRPKEQRG